jgi:hypothetical protein
MDWGISFVLVMENNRIQDEVNHGSPFIKKNLLCLHPENGKKKSRIYVFLTKIVRRNSSRGFLLSEITNKMYFFWSYIHI